MNVFKKAYYRLYQGAFYLMLPLLPYRQPKILHTDNEVVEVLNQKGINKVLLVTDKGIRGLGLTASLEKKIQESGKTLAVYDQTVPNPTTQNVKEALEVYNQNNCEGLVAFGGGSVMDCAKAVGAKVARPNKSLKQMKGVLKVGRKIPTLIAVPTTAGTGSETTLAAVITDSETRHKYAINDFPLIPSFALLKPELTQNLPKHITSTTGMDALTHAIEAYIGRSTTRQTRAHALAASKAIFENLVSVYNNGQDLDKRAKLLQAAYDAGVAFTKSYVGYVHAIAHTLGGKYDLPHGLANAIILPYVLKAFGKSVHKKLWKMGVHAGLFAKEVSKQDGAKLFIEKIEEMNKAMGIPTKIAQIKEKDIPTLAKIAEKEANPLYPVPKLFDAKQLEEIYHQIKE